MANEHDGDKIINPETFNTCINKAQSPNDDFETTFRTCLYPIPLTFGRSTMALRQGSRIWAVRMRRLAVVRIVRATYL